VCASPNKGGLLGVGTEVFGQAIDDLTTAEAGIRAATTTHQLLDDAQTDTTRSCAQIR
jgi:hypothetical protein